MVKPLFLKADWNNLLMLNYEVNPEILKPYLPPCTELDLWQGKALVSMVGFMFLNTSVLGVKWPFHINFEEVNLRFYVRHFDGSVWKRGAVFVSEIVPKPIIAFFANTLYKEHYSAMLMRHSVAQDAEGNTQYLYEWKKRGNWNKLGATVANDFADIKPGSEEEFIFEHYWGYNTLNPNTTMQYQVEHVSWQTATCSNYIFEADIAALYGKAFEPFLSAKPHSVFFAKGSRIGVRIGEKIRVGVV